MRRICVFCGSSSGEGLRYLEAAARVRLVAGLSPDFAAGLRALADLAGSLPGSEGVLVVTRYLRC